MLKRPGKYHGENNLLIADSTETQTPNGEQFIAAIDIDTAPVKDGQKPRKAVSTASTGVSPLDFSHFQM